MNEMLVRGKTIPEAYHKALQVLDYCGDISSCNDWSQAQKEMSITIMVDEPLSEPMISKLYIGGFMELQEYVMMTLDGILDFEIQKGNWTYTYHDRMVNLNGVNQLEFILNELKRNPDSRRAVISFRDVEIDTANDDTACLQNIQYFIRDNKLHCKVLMRSNDAAKATFMNMFAFVMLQKRIADELGIEVGSYVHRANSFHVYQRDFEMLKGYVKTIGERGLNYPTYNYSEFYKELMDECVDEINAKVEKLKGNI